MTGKVTPETSFLPETTTNIKDVFEDGFQYKKEKIFFSMSHESQKSQATESMNFDKMSRVVLWVESNDK